MALSLSHFPVLAFLLLPFGLISHAAIVNYDFNITWLLTNPDGAFDRPTIGINGQWPLPQISATVGDQVVVNVHNQLGNQSTSLHFHGLFMNGTTEMDGPVGTSQCAIPPGASFLYNFTVDQPGTYWYHSHNNGQYPDGLRGPLIINDPDSPYNGQYDEELVLTLSDWYHAQMVPLIKQFISVTNPTGAEPVPDAALMNDTQNLSVAVQPGKTYLLRMVNMAAFAAQYFWIEGHTMRVVEVDGVYTEPAEADMIYLTAAQRYSVLVTTKNDTSSNFVFVGSMDQDLFDTVPDTLNPNVTGWLVYDQAKDLPTPALLESFEPLDDFNLVPVDGKKIFDDVDYSFNLDVKMDNLGDGANYAFFNGITYVRPKVPTLYTAMSTGLSATNAEIYGVNSQAFILNKDDVIEIVVNNNDPGKHPFHLHGHNFQAVLRSEEDAGFYHSSNATAFPQVPMRRDTFMVRPNGHMVLRFRADNPDKCPVLLLTSHWLTDPAESTHLAVPLPHRMAYVLQKTLTIPEGHLQVCRDQGEPIAGNAAGNTKDYLDLNGANLPPAPLPAGFTARGIVALVFSVLSALVGMGFIAWYGAGELGSTELGSAKKRIAKAGAIEKEK
ncbi:MAG: hypothetical protein M1827_001160 [Pycnora praestabilis]|nr:MAG: hypothetical protein M1827_001160 [Pycnora praestabilis]